MKMIITAPRGKMAGLIVADAASREDVKIVAGIGPAGRDYIGKDIGLVVGTTGFNAEQRARLEAAASEIPIMIAANTDRMVNVMRKLLMDAAKELYDDTDIEIIDMHDNTKLDAPSGTARELIESMGEAVGVDLVGDAVYGRPLGRHPRENGKVTFHAVRGGDTPSSHTVYFFGEGERLEITHHCLNWKGCAKGAVNACRWMVGKPVGLYGIRESMGL